jgi:iron complex outermembrane receptor protein
MKQIVILFTIFILSIFPASGAKQDSVKVYTLGETIEVRDKRISASFESSLKQVSVISKEEISAAPVSSVNELLEYAKAADIRQRGGYGVQADISLRGGSANQTVILLNGINITDPQTGHLTMNLPLSLDAVERIEILEGPAASVSIPKPFAGAINIITNTSSKSKATVKAIAGQDDFYEVGATGNIVHNDKFSQFMAVSSMSSDGWRDNTDFENKTAFWHGKYLGAKFGINTQAGYSEKEYGANSFYTPVYPNQFEANKTYFASAQADIFSVIDLSPQVYWRRNTDRFELFRGQPEIYAYNYHVSDIAGASLNLRKNWLLGTTRAGIDFRKEQILSNNLGFDDDSVKVPGEEAYYTKKYDRDNFAISLTHSLELGDFRVTAAIAGDYSSDADDIAFLPGLDFAYTFTDFFELYTSANISRRLPTFTERFYKGPTNEGNPDLEPEKAMTLEGGMIFSPAPVTIKANYYFRDGENIIDWIKLSEEDTWSATNITTLQTQGLGISIDANRAFLQKHIPFIKHLRLSYDYCTQDRDSKGYISKYALDYLKHKASMSITHDIAAGFFASWRASYQDREGAFQYYDSIEKVYGEEKEYEPFIMLDAKLNFQYKQAVFFIEASNLLDETYYEFSNIPNPGRTLRCGFRAEIN